MFNRKKLTEKLILNSNTQVKRKHCLLKIYDIINFL